MKDAKGVIYRIRCVPNGKVYIGSSVNVLRRFYLHKLALNKNKHHSPKLQNAWNKYGSESFVFEELEIVDDILFLVAREQCWMWRNEGVLLNCAMVAGSPIGVKRTDAQKKRMSEAKIAYASTERGREIIKKMHDANLGRKQTPEEREMRSRALKGKATGRKWTVEERERHSKDLIGRKMPPVADSTKKAISVAKLGKKMTAEQIEKNVASRRLIIERRLPLWIKLKGEGKSLREIEKITGHTRSVISRELKEASKV